MAQRFGDARALLVGAQLGSAMLSSLNDPATLAMTARMAGLDVANVLRWSTAMLTESQSEMFVAQAGMIMDTLAHSARAMDKVMGDTIRTGAAAKIGGAVIRASGLRKWTEALKGGFWLGAIAQVAHERGKAFAELDPVFDPRSAASASPRRNGRSTSRRKPGSRGQARNSCGRPTSPRLAARKRRRPRKSWRSSSTPSWISP
jgi:hypothetical protein